MLEVIAVMVGLGVVTLAPSIPGLRNVAREVVKGGLVMSHLTKDVVLKTKKLWTDLVDEVQAEKTKALPVVTGEPPVKTAPVAAAPAQTAAVDRPAAEVKASEMPPTAASTGSVDQETPPVGDDLTQVKGIGPKAASLLNQAGIHTLAQLAQTEVAQLKEILNQAGPRFRVVDPSTWPSQAQELTAAQ